jgi:vitamin B12 transporter
MFKINESVLTTSALMAMIITGTISTTTFAANDDNLETFTLDPVTVTATRVEKNDLSTASAVEIVSHDKLMKTGTANLQEALKYNTGIIVHSQGVRGISQGTMVSKVVIRGVEKGTLVLVDGVPLNQGGRYNLDDIPLDSIEKVEIVRGGGAVLYGSEATGGVVNVITKKKRQNSIRVSAGNYGIQDHAFNAQIDKLGISYNYDKTGSVYNISNPEYGRPTGMSYSLIRGEHNNVNGRYDFNDDVFLTLGYGRNYNHYLYRYAPQDYLDYKHATYNTTYHNGQLHYEKNGLKAILSYTNRDQETNNSIVAALGKKTKKYAPSTPVDSTSEYNDKTLGLDVQKQWKLNDNSLLLGFNGQKDTFDLSDVADYQRYMYSVYGQYGWHIGKSSDLNFNARETWTAGATANQNYSKFTPEIEYINKLNDNTSFYAKVGESFMMPTFTQLYGTSGTATNILGNADLKPQNGIHYEVGLKKNIGNQAWRLALYHYKIDDSIEASWKQDRQTKNYYVTYNNEDIRNTGVELTWDVDCGNGLSANLGASWSHPQKLSSSTTSGVTTEGDWNDYYGKLQFNGGIAYKKDKLSTSLDFNYLGSRTRDYTPWDSLKPQLFTDFQLSYSPVKNNRFFVNVDNIFDRQDIVSTSSSEFYSLGRNFTVGYELKF